MSISLNQIKDTCSTITIYNKGYQLLKNNMLTNFNVVDLGDLESTQGMSRIDAKIAEENTDFHQSRIWVSTDTIIDFECDCQGNLSKTGACSHVACALINYFNINNPTKITPPIITKDSERIDLLLSTYKNLSLHHSIIKDNISIFPSLTIDSHSSSFIECQIGDTNRYVINNLYQFVDAIENKRTLIYGKHLEFTHAPNNFTPSSQKLAALIVDGVNDLLQLNSSNHFFAHSSTNNKKLYLSYSLFERFFEIMVDETIPATIHKLPQKHLLLKSENPQLNFTIKEEADTFTLSHTLNELNICIIHKHYIVIGDVLYRCSEDFAKDIFPLLRELIQSDTQSLILTKQTMPSFYHYILEKLLHHTQLDMSSKIQEIYQAKTLHTKLSLDYTKKTLLLKVAFYYGELAFNPLDEKLSTPFVVRNFSKESNLLNKLESYGFISNSKGFFSLNDEQQLYYFLTKGIQSLKDECEIHVSKNFRNLRVITSTSLQPTLKVNNNLLEFDLGNLPFPKEELIDVLNAFTAKKTYYKLGSGDFLALENLQFEQLNTLKQHLNLNKKTLASDIVKLPLYQAVYIDELFNSSSTKDTPLTIEGSISSFLTELKHSTSHYPLPITLENTLRDYQVKGVNWLRTLSSHHLGGILADDMGLGKTLQIITLLLATLEDFDTPHIIVMPTSLILNWGSEFKKFAPSLNTIAILGAASTRKKLIKNLSPGDIVLTSYDSLKRDLEYYTPYTFGYCIADEAHYIKNPSTQNAKALKSIDSTIRFALTGTPIENTLAELWSILDFVLPGYLGHYSYFKEHFEKNISLNQDQTAEVDLKKLIAPFILRRLKKDVLTELPEKTETTLYCDLKNIQKKLYSAYAFKAKTEIFEEVNATTHSPNKVKILSHLTRLRQICCHPKLFLEDYTGASEKLKLCLELTENTVASGHKLLIFSQFVSMLDILEKELTELGISFYTLKGDVKPKQRQKLVDDFNNDDTSVFLISLKAGGVGLNLTSADVVIHYDPWWNISVQNQATDRAYRIGQNNNVQVFKLITKDTIEEKIELMQHHKLQLSENIIPTDNSFISSLTENDLMNLLP